MCIRDRFDIAPTSFSVIGSIPTIELLTIFKVIVLAVLCAAVSMLFCLTLKKTHKLYDKIPNKTVAAIVGGLAVAILTFIIGTTD